MPTKTDTAPVESPIAKIAEFGTITPDVNILAILDDAFGPAGWTFEIDDASFPPNYFSVRGTLKAGEMVRDGISMIPLDGLDPNEGAQLAFSEALRYAVHQLGGNVQYREFPAYEKTDRYGKPTAQAAPAYAQAAPAPTAPPAAYGAGSICADCRQPLTDYTTTPRAGSGKSPTLMTVKKQEEMTMRSTGRILCRACNSAVFKASNPR